MTPDPLDSRINELEVKTSFTEDLLEQLNQTVVRQQRQIEQLARELRALRDQIPDDDASGQPTLREQLPPHY